MADVPRRIARIPTPYVFHASRSRRVFPAAFEPAATFRVRMRRSPNTFSGSLIAAGAGEAAREISVPVAADDLCQRIDVVFRQRILASTRVKILTEVSNSSGITSSAPRSSRCRASLTWRVRTTI